MWLTGRRHQLVATDGDPRNIVLCSRAIRLAHCNACTSSASTLYREVADRVVDVDQLTPDEIADRILA